MPKPTQAEPAASAAPGSADPRPNPERQAYRLRLPHTHAGQIYQAGATVMLTAEQLERVKRSEDKRLAKEDNHA